MTTPDDTTGKRPKPIELVARALNPNAYEDRDKNIAARDAWKIAQLSAIIAFNTLTKHGCISIEGIIARDEEMGK